GESVALILGARATREAPLALAGKIAAATGARLLAPTLTPRIARGAGRVPVERIPYPVDQAIAALQNVQNLILVGAKAPVAFFAYPDKPSTLFRPGTRIHELARAEQDVVTALEALVDAVGASTATAPVPRMERPGRPTGSITPEKLGALLAAPLLPETAWGPAEPFPRALPSRPAPGNGPPHDWIIGTGGSIGYALPVALGAAVACPDRKVVCLESDGSGLYMPQSLWTH